VVHDRHFHLPDRRVVFHQQIVVPVNAAADGVFNRQHAILRRSLLDPFEHFLEGLAGTAWRRR
jgi:hypothetical protein